MNLMPRLHAFEISLSVRAGDDLLPPRGIFDWHYLQCVAKRFATQDYRGIPNIYFYENPFKTADDESADEFCDDGEGEPPYPTYRFDRYLREQGRIKGLKERSSDIAHWATEVK